MGESWVGLKSLSEIHPPIAVRYNCKYQCSSTPIAKLKSHWTTHDVILLKWTRIPAKLDVKWQSSHQRDDWNSYRIVVTLIPYRGLEQYSVMALFLCVMPYSWISLECVDACGENEGALFASQCNRWGIHDSTDGYRISCLPWVWCQWLVGHFFDVRVLEKDCG